MGYNISESLLTVNVSPAGDVTSEVIRQCFMITRKLCNSYIAIVIDRLTQFHDSNVKSETDVWK